MTDDPKALSYGCVRPRDRVGLDVITVLEILQDAYPTIVQNEQIYRQTIDRIGRFLRDRDAEIEADTIRQFNTD